MLVLSITINFTSLIVMTQFIVPPASSFEATKHDMSIHNYPDLPHTTGQAHCPAPRSVSRLRVGLAVGPGREGRRLASASVARSKIYWPYSVMNAIITRSLLRSFRRCYRCANPPPQASIYGWSTATLY